MRDHEIHASRELAEFNMNYVADMAEECLPESGSFTLFGSRFQVDDTDFKAVIWVDCDERDRDVRHLWVGVHHQYRNRMWQNLLLTGSTAKVIAALRDPSTLDEVIQCAEQLTAKAEDFYGPLGG